MADTLDPEVAATVTAELAIPPMADSDEVTRLVLSVASEEAAYIKGAEFVIDGGLPLGPVSKPK